LIQVFYHTGGRGSVDDITLDELIQKQKISRFYRPVEERWVNVGVDPVRSGGRAQGAEVLKRRDSDREEVSEQKTGEDKPGGLFDRFLKGRKRDTPPKGSGTKDWFARGLVMFRVDNDCPGAARAFARAIRANPGNERAYVNRGLVYEHLENLQQAIEDYSMSISLDPNDGKAHYFRGLAFRRLGMDENALRDLKRAAELRYTAAEQVLESMSHPLHSSSRG